MNTKKIKGRNHKLYKEGSVDNTNMLPGDRNGSPDESYSKETLVFIDAGFVSKLSKYFGNGNYLIYNLFDFAKNISKKQGLFCKKIFYYTVSLCSQHENLLYRQELQAGTAPPFQSEPSTRQEEIKKEGYDKFVKRLREKGVIIREGRCQRLKINSKFEYKQKAVDVFLAMDLTNVPLKYPNIKRIMLIATDSDFVPVIKNLEEKEVKTILYTYYEKKRNTNFSRSNDLIKSVYKYVLLSKQDFISCPLNKSKSKK